uniref:Uncharacterized protein n=1 Tax=Arundo donax TaxID=35708 RepID=A0A0A8YZB1_ARUDO
MACSILHQPCGHCFLHKLHTLAHCAHNQQSRAWELY